MDARTRSLVSILVIALAVAATAFALRLRPPPPPPPGASNEPLFDFAAREVRSIEVRAWQGSLRAGRVDGGWRVDEVSLRRPGAGVDVRGDEPPPAKPSSAEIDHVVESLVREVVGLPVIDRFPREGRELADFGLAEPQATIALGLENGGTRRLELGSLTIANSALYARSAPPDDIVEIGTLVFSAIDSTLYHLRALASSPAAPAATPAPQAGG
jgi:hypothetical protein